MVLPSFPILYQGTSEAQITQQGEEHDDGQAPAELAHFRKSQEAEEHKSRDHL